MFALLLTSVQDQGESSLSRHSLFAFG